MQKRDKVNKILINKIKGFILVGLSLIAVILYFFALIKNWNAFS